MLHCQPANILIYTNYVFAKIDSTSITHHHDTGSYNSTVGEKRQYPTIGPLCIVPSRKKAKPAEISATSSKPPTNKTDVISAVELEDKSGVLNPCTNTISSLQNEVTMTVTSTVQPPTHYEPNSIPDSAFTNANPLIDYKPTVDDTSIIRTVHSSMKSCESPDWAPLDRKLEQDGVLSQDSSVVAMGDLTSVVSNTIHSRSNSSYGPTVVAIESPLAKDVQNSARSKKKHTVSKDATVLFTKEQNEQLLNTAAAANAAGTRINWHQISQSLNRSAYLCQQHLQQLMEESNEDTRTDDAQQLQINISPNSCGNNPPRGSNAVTVTETNGQPTIPTLRRPCSKSPKFSEEDARLLDAAAVANATGSRINWFQLGQSLNIGADRCEQRLQHLMGHNNSDTSAANVSAVNINSTSRKIQEEKLLRDAVRKAHKKNGIHINWEQVSHTLKRSISYCKQKWQVLSARSKNTGNNRLNCSPTAANTTTGANIGSNRFDIITDETPQGANVDNECTIRNGAKVLLFTQEHDAMLMSAAAAAKAAKSSINWFQISQSLNRSAYLCRQRLQQLMRRNYNDSHAVNFDSDGCSLYTSANTVPSTPSASSVVAPNGIATNSLATAPRAFPFKTGRFSLVEDQLILERVPLSLHTSRELFRGFAPLSQELNRPIDVVKNRWMKLYNASRPPNNFNTNKSNVGACILPVMSTPVTPSGSVSNTASSRALPAGLSEVVSSTRNEKLTLVHADTNGNVLAANRPSVTTTIVPEMNDVVDLAISDTNSTAQTINLPLYESITTTCVVNSDTNSALFTERDIPNNSEKAAAGTCALALTPLQVEEQVSPEMKNNIFVDAFVESNCDNYW